MCRNPLVPSCVVLASLLGAVDTAPAQYYYGAPEYHSSTAAEGAARGMASVIRSQGMYNLTTSQAAINASEARKNEIENYRLRTETYFDARQLNRQYRQEQLRPQQSEENWIRIAQMGAPRPLKSSELDSVTGEINWPVLLRDEQFAEARQELQDLFAHRGSTGHLGADEYLQAKQITDAMMDSLQQRVRDVPPAKYAAAKTFLQSLAYTAGQPAA